MKEQATRQQAETKTRVLSPNLQARFSELQALIDRYLDNEALQTYTESLDRKRAERAEAAKSKNKRKPEAQAAPSAPTAPPGFPGQLPPPANRGDAAERPAAQPKTAAPEH